MGKKILNIKKIVVSACIPGGWGAGGNTSFSEANGDVPLDWVTFSRLD